MISRVFMQLCISWRLLKSSGPVSAELLYLRGLHPGRKTFKVNDGDLYFKPGPSAFNDLRPFTSAGVKDEFRDCTEGGCHERGGYYSFTEIGTA